MTGTDPIAVVGLACRLPGASSPAEFWRLLRDGVDAVGEVPESRRRHAGGPGYGAFLERVDAFDPEFFGISPREAAVMDPQQRLMLELAWEALENAGIVPYDLSRTATAVYASAIWDDYAELAHRRGGPARTHHTFAGTRRAMLANRVSYALGCTGPSLTVDTGQSSSLVAVHLACESLRRGESTLALVGGVNLVLAPGSTATSDRMGALSASGRCRTFDAAADGYVRGEGGAVLVLKPLPRALADGDFVSCVIRGSAVNNDGGGDSLGAPRRRTQEEVLRLAYRRAGTDPGAVQFVELHGTGTPAGDPVEAAALGAVVGAARPAGDPVRVGSVKTNIGHLEGAAGIVGLLKVVLSVRGRELAPSLHYVTPHPGIPLDRLNLRVQATRAGWPRPERPLVAGVSSFGLGGTNCHVVVAEPEIPAPGGAFGGAGGSRAEGSRVAGADAPSLPWPFSARGPAALREQSARLLRDLRAHPGRTPQDVGLSLATTRARFDHRAVVLAPGEDRLRDGAARLSRGEPAPGVVQGVVLPGAGPVFVFPGQGSQWRGMALELYEESEVFAGALDECAAALAPYTGRSLLADVRGELSRGDVVQPALWAVMVSLARLWESFGVVPSAVVGHSQGEIAAAVVAGALSLEEGARVAALRSQVIARGLAGQGGLVSVALPADEVRDLLAAVGGGLCVGAVNGPAATVVSGPPAALEKLTAVLAVRRIRTRRVDIDYASHSAQVDAVVPELLDVLGEVCTRSCRVPFCSTVTGEMLDGRELDAGYWVRNLRRTVRFSDVVRHLLGRGHRLFIETGPHPVLSAAVSATADALGVEAGAVGSLRRGDGGRQGFLTGVAQAWTRGAAVAWEAAFEGLGARRVPLPTYPFQRTGHWLPPGADEASDEASAAAPPAGPETGDAAPVSVPAGAPAAGDRQGRSLLDVVRSHAAAVLGYADPERVAERTTFKDAGFDSHMSVELRDRLATATGQRLPSDVLFSFPTPAALAERLGARPTDPSAAAGARERSDRRPGDEAGDEAGDEPIAVVGMACRYPGGVRSPEDLWRLVADGTDAITGFPHDRGWDTGGAGRTWRGGFLAGATEFDAGFFGISPREALTMDPQQRVLLEVCWEAVERSGIVPATLRGTTTGVFVGAMAQEYGARLDQAPEGFEGQILTGGTPSVLSGRVAYTLGLHGPALTVDTACSSSLVSLHLAAQSLRQGDCSLALAGGVAVMANPGMFLEFGRQGGLSADGRCKAFGAAADGTSWAEGAGVLVLERLSYARRNGHRVLALLRGSAVNQDGASNGLTAPHGPAQEQVIRRALAAAGLTAGDVDAVEAHGTGTRLGDPIEAHALLATYGQDRDPGDPLYLGSLKSNIGHAQAAAGVGGVIKMVLAMRNGVLPPTLHADPPSPHVDWASGAVALLAETRAWPGRGRPRRAGVSSFGISGTNAHVIVEEAAEPAEPVDARPEPAAPVVVWPVSGHTPRGLAAQAGRLRDFARAHPGHAAADIGWSLAATRAALEHRAVAIGGNADDLTKGLAALAAGEPAAHLVTGRATGVGAGPVFVFPGQGSQWRGMALELSGQSAAFAEALDECAAVLAPWTGRSLRADLEGDLGRADVVQPALWAVMVSLARLWESFGVAPSAVVGHSQGEIAAAVVAGALSLEDGARVAALRSRVIARRLAGGGGMVSVALPPDAVRERLDALGGGLCVAAVNGPATTVVSGPLAALAELTAALAAEQVRVRRANVDYASHSAQVDAIAAELAEVLGEVRTRSCRVPFCSTVTGEMLDGRELDAGYWVRNLRRPVRFSDAVRKLLGQGHRMFIETSAHPVLTMGVQETAEADAVAVGSLRRGDGGAERFLTSLAEAHVHGAAVDWAPAFHGARAVDLPTYAFERRRYWMAAPAPAAHTGDHPLARSVTRLADSDAALLTASLSRRTAPWLADHVVSGSVLLPGAALVELVLRAGEEVGCGRLEELILHAPLHLPERDAVQVQIAVRPPEDGTAAVPRRPVVVHARPAGAAPGEPWAGLAAGVLAPARGVPGGSVRTDWPPADAELLTADTLYAELAALGYDYGPAFRGLGAAWRRGGEVFAEVALPAGDPLAAAGYGIHPALLDACLHAALPGRVDERAGRPALPFAWSGVELFATGATAARVRIVPDGEGAFALHVADAAGRPLATVESLTLRESTAADDAARADGSGRLYRIRWRPAALPDSPTAAGNLPAAAGGSPASPADPAGAAGSGTPAYVLDGHATDLSALTDPVPPTVIAPVPDTGTAEDAATRVLGLVQEWLADERFAASRLAVAVTGEGPAQAAVAGLVRTARTEHPGRFALAHVTDDPGYRATVAALASLDEPEISVVAGQVRVPRLENAARRLPTAPADATWRIDATARGTLDSLAALPAPAAAGALPAGHVRVAMGAAGLNFRDVLIGLDMYPGRADMGVEGAGTVTGVGPGVTEPAVGDRVLGLIPGAMGPVAVADARTLVRMPEGWTFAQGAAVPVAYLTAWMGLVDGAGLARGERVLVHAATGGLGLAALHVARHMGAEVFATAAPAKQHLLRRLGLADDHIASSRDLDFRQRFREATGGAGMDVVLHTLAGEFTDASLDLLPRGGRFVEMGKTDVRDADAVAADRPGVVYRPFDLLAEDPGRVGDVLRRLAGLFAAGTLPPPPITAWDIREAPDAFETLKDAGHLGKAVLTLPRRLDPDRTVLITGGTGTLGRLLARHLVTRHGIRHLLLAGRRGLGADGAEAFAAELADLGAHVHVAACDVGDRRALRGLLAAVPADRPLGAVIHAAGTLDDAVVESLTPARVARVLRAKTRAAQHLDELTAGLDLDAFVLFSSVAGLLGTAGQANYAAANATLDALARHRRRRGLPAVSLAWGLWREAGGMTGHLAERDLDRLAGAGVAPLDSADGLALFDAALAGGEPVQVAARLDLPGLRRQAAAGELAALFGGLVGTVRPQAAAGAPAGEAGADDGALARRLAGTPPEERRRVLLGLVRSQAATVLRHGTAQEIVPDRPFRELGFDSLTAVELRNRLTTAAGVRLPSTVVFRHPTPSELADRLHTELFPPGPEHTASNGTTGTTGTTGPTVTAATGPDAGGGGGAPEHVPLVDDELLALIDKAVEGE
ncbi:type I polyketide synthase [Streptomyces synnematoformans]|uniref:Type I polyketide synthase n=1 Tax=Streptomyces synnematoformans TaxID=415721 RepID=A0ABN2XGF2_9ACTN